MVAINSMLSLWLNVAALVQNCSKTFVLFVCSLQGYIKSKLDFQPTFWSLICFVIGQPVEFTASLKLGLVNGEKNYHIVLTFDRLLPQLFGVQAYARV